MTGDFEDPPELVETPLKARREHPSLCHSHLLLTQAQWLHGPVFLSLIYIPQSCFSSKPIGSACLLKQAHWLALSVSRPAKHPKAATHTSPLARPVCLSSSYRSHGCIKGRSRLVKGVALRRGRKWKGEKH